MSEPKDPNQDPELQPTVAWSPEDVPDDEAGSSVDDPLVGTVLRGKWRVLSRIGAGSFGTVYKVRDEKGGWIEALKILSVDRLRGPEGEATRARFLREARIMKRLGARSRHIVRLSTYEEDLEAGLVYFLMEHVEGRNLAQVLDEEGPFSMGRAISVALQVCDALIAAHESDPPVVHRDLKLQNLMLTEEDGSERLMVLDFGIAKIAAAGPDSRLTAAGAIGTPGYAAPEQLRAEAVDGRTDLFALGVILYALVTGRDPWLGKLAHQPTDQVYRLMAATDRGEILPMSESGQTVPPALAHIIMRLLRRDPAERFQSARDLRDALLEISEAESLRPAGGTPPRLPSRPREGASIRERRLAAVWFADLVGYSTLSATDEGAALELLELFHSTARKVIEEGGGRLVQFIGDAAFAEFTSTDRPVRTAMLFHERFEMATTGSDPQPLLRTGVHVGDVLMGADGDLFGDGVNVAARIQNEAEPGQIVVSQDVWRQLKQRRDFRFKSIGERSLKGLGSPVWLFAVLREPAEDGTSSDLSTDSPMVAPGARRGRLVHVAGVALAHLTASGAMLFASTVLVQRYGFPAWVVPVAGVLLAVGLVMVLVTAWVQSRPTWERSVGARSAWSLDLPDMARVLRRGRLPELTWARTMLGGVLAFAALFGVAAVLPVVSAPGEATVPSAAVPSPALDAGASVAVMPFRADGVDAPVGDGMADLVAYSAELAGARVEHPLVLHGRLDGSPPPDTDEAVRLARLLDDSHVVIGTVSQDGGTVTVEAGLVDAGTGEEVRSASVTGSVESLGSMAAGLVDELLAGTPLVAGAELDLPVVSDSHEALSAYLEGEAALRRGAWSDATTAFERARGLDPDFALARARLAFARAVAGGPGPHVVDEDARRALELGTGLSGRQRGLVEGLVLLGEGSEDAIAVFRSLTEDDSDDPEAWHLLGDAIYHLSGPSAPGYRDAFERAMALSDGYAPAQAHLVASALELGDTGRARMLVSDLRARDPESAFLASLEEAVRVVEAAPADEDGDGPAPAVERPDPDPAAEARADYRQALQSLDQLRRRVTADGLHPALTSRMDRADGVRGQAESAAEREEYDRATALVDDARDSLQSIVADQAVLRRYESTREDLADAREQARDGAAREEARRLEASAEAALESGRYAEALSMLEEAADAWREAATGPEPEADPAPDPPPSAIARQLLDDLAAAIASEDIAEVRSIWTSITPEESGGLVTLFDAVRNLQVVYDIRAVREDGERIVVDVHTIYEFVAEQGGQRVTQEVDQLFELGRRGDAWVVVGSE